MADIYNLFDSLAARDITENLPKGNITEHRLLIVPSKKMTQKTMITMQ